MSALDVLIERSAGDELAERARAELAALRAENATADEFRKAWNERDRELLRLMNERDALREQVRAVESEVRFYNGLVMGDGDHDKIMLARDGEVFLRCFKLLGMDISETGIQEIPDAIERLKGKP